MFLALYVLLRWVLQLAVLRLRSNESRGRRSSCCGTNWLSSDDTRAVRR